MAKNATDTEWTSDIRQEFVLAWGLGWSINKIARHLSQKFQVNVTRNAVAGKRRRMKLPPREKIIFGDVSNFARAARDESSKQPQQVKVKRVRNRVRVPRNLISINPRVVALPPIPGSTCCWPIGEPRTPSFRYCDVPLTVRGDYCDEHHALAYLPRRMVA